MENHNLKQLVFNLLDNKSNVSQTNRKIRRFKKYYPIDIEILCEKGNLNGLEWKNKYNLPFIGSTMPLNGFIQYTIKTNAMDTAAIFGHLEIVMWLYLFRPSREWCTSKALHMAAINGHLDIVRFLLVENNIFFPSYLIPTYILDIVMDNKHYEIYIILLNNNRSYYSYSVNRSNTAYLVGSPTVSYQFIGTNGIAGPTITGTSTGVSSFL